MFHQKSILTKIGKETIKVKPGQSQSLLSSLLNRRKVQLDKEILHFWLHYCYIAHYSTLSMLVWILSVYPSTMCVKWWRWWHWVEDQGWLGFSKVFAKIFSSIDEDVKKEELNKENLIKISNRRKLFLECYKHEYQGVSTFLHQPTLSTIHPKPFLPNPKNFYC